MQVKFSRFILVFFGIVSIIFLGCNKIDTTELGTDLIPDVDNIHTFADSFDINGVREALADSTRLALLDNVVLGAINNDPVFGKTKADVFIQLKPTFFPYYFGSANDTITSFDSVVLCFSYKGFYGDSTIAQNISVYTLDPQTSFQDSAYKLSYQPDFPFTNLVGQKTITPGSITPRVYFNNGKDSITNQLRIKLDASFLNKISKFDSNYVNPVAGNEFALYSDSVFRTILKGFAVTSSNGSPGNGLFYLSLTDPATRLEIYYKKTKAGVKDTTYASWPVSTGATFNILPSAHANHINRDTANAEFKVNPQPDALYIQTAPGLAISFNIPEFNNYPNRIIHRAEITLQELPGDPLNSILTAPPFLYLDLIDDTSASKKYKPIYYDLNPNAFYNPDDNTQFSSLFFPTGGIDHNYFGGFVRNITDANGTRATYTFNITRYVQNTVTKMGKNFAMRIYAPYNLNYNGLSLIYRNNLALGRVKIGNGNHPLYPMKVKIIYSNL